MGRWRTIGWAPLALMAACSSAPDEADNAAEPVALVKLARVANGGVARSITVYGAADPGSATKLSMVAPAEAKVAAIVAPAGTPVQAGQVVVRLIASPTTRAEAAKAATDATAANAAYARAQRLRADGLNSDADVETARAAAAAATALRASYASKVGGLTVRAPGAGTVDGVVVATGDLLQPGAAIASIMRSGDVRVRFGVDPDTAQRLHAGMALRIEGSATRAPLSVTIESVSLAADPQTRLASLFARIPAGSGIVAGEALTATVQIDQPGSALTVPYAALLDDAGQPYVFVVAGGVAHRRDIAIAPSSGDRVTVTKGLSAADSVVVEGGTALEDGMKVRTQ